MCHPSQASLPPAPGAPPSGVSPSPPSGGGDGAWPYADVILPLPFGSFTYAVPDELLGCVEVGSRVEVPFGKSKAYAGVVARLHSHAPEGVQLRPLRRLLEPQPIVTQGQLRFYAWVADYYMSALGDVYKAALPSPCRAVDTSPRDASPDECAGSVSALPALSPAQQEAMAGVCSAWQGGKDIVLLHGVTGSGKTEIYIHLIAAALARGEQALYLLPEIALTTQMQERLRRVFGACLGVYHSQFTPRQRERVYRRQLSPHPFAVVLAVRSGIFLPFSHLGLVIIDEEQEPSYKQEEPAPRYHARNAALMLARMSGARVLLGTATPSVETLHHARTGRYGYVPLTLRFRSAPQPRVEVVDIAQQQFRRRMRGAFSPPLVEAIHACLERHEQVILFQNRRGYAPLLICARCGWVPRCTRCDVSLTVHKRSRQLVCHYCGNRFPIPRSCPCCTSPSEEGALPPTERRGRGTLTAAGAGTERIEAQAAALFPEARIERLDLDAAPSSAAFERILTLFARREIDILIGTQMVAKGLDFPGVGLVGVLDADRLLRVADFRAPERAFHLLAQVAGRAGRGGTPARVIVQTRTPQDPIITQMAQGDYDAMFTQQIAERRLFLYPPFARLIFIYLRHRESAVAERGAQAMGTYLRATFGSQVYGPEPPVVEYVRGLHTRKIMLKVSPDASTAGVRQALRQAEQTVRQLPLLSRLDIYFDVDPL